jgi:peptide deformylase
MAILKVLTVPALELRKKAVKIPVVDESVRKLAGDMIATMQAEKGVGLAAPQVGKSLKLIVLQPPEGEPFALINPQITRREGEREVLEACLSIPGYEGYVMRSVSVSAKGLDHCGKPVKIKATDLLAQALEHEVDHLNGVLYPDLIEEPDKFFRVEASEEEPAPTTNVRI